LYPAGLWALGRFFTRRVRRDESLQPSVALLICAYNEEAIIAEKLKNSLDLDYPADRLQILVASDNSSDRTDEITQSLTDARIVFHRSDQRVGKTALLNQMVPRTRAEILVFSDANALYQPDALRKLVRNFADPEVSYVTGCSRYIDVNASA